MIAAGYEVRMLAKLCRNSPRYNPGPRGNPSGPSSTESFLSRERTGDGIRPDWQAEASFAVARGARATNRREPGRVLGIWQNLTDPAIAGTFRLWT